MTGPGMKPDAPPRQAPPSQAMRDAVTLAPMTQDDLDAVMAWLVSRPDVDMKRVVVVEQRAAFSAERPASNL